jgi:signal transduction histidine kinase
MGNHGAVSTRARAGAANNHAGNSTNVDSFRSRALNLSDWPVSRRLFAVIVVALLMGLIFGGLRVASAESSAAQFGRVSQLATLDQRLSVLIQDLQNERDASLNFLLSGDASPMRSLYAQTDQAVLGVQQSASGIGGAFPANIQADATTVLADISASRIATLHDTLNPQVPQSEQSVIGNYAAVINDMITLADQTAQGVADATLASDVRAFDALGLAKEQVSQQRGLLNYLFSTAAGPNDGTLQVDPNTLQALQIASGNEFTDESAFQAAASPAELTFSDSAITSPAAATDVAYAQELEQTIFSNVGATPAVGLLGDVQQGIGPTNNAGNGPFTTLTQGQQVWNTGMTDDINAMQSTENLLADNILNRADQLQSGAQGSALITAIITAVVLLLVLAAALLVARSLVLPLRRLRAGALDVASVQLPERVRRLSESPDPSADLEVAPIAVLTTDEIGQVARAFDQVHAEAVRLAGNEAVLRTSFNAMFVNLSRRSQSLIERLARMIDSLEQNEDDPDRLSNLFSMDHLVTRMRRNSENLLLLAGHETPRKWTDPVPLADITRAATSEIEQYNRVVLNVQPGVAVIGQAVSDVVHLLAELIENATIFSPNDTQVQVSAQELTSGGVLIEVTDKGIGVSESRLAEMNWRLDNPPRIDVSVSRHMGLFAVARLAERHRIRIRLRPAVPQGLTALVWLPDTVIERSARTYSGTGSWQPAVADGFLDSRRPSGQHSLAAAASPRSSGRHGVMRQETAATLDRDDGISLPSAPAGAIGTAGQVSQATSNWFRSRHTAMRTARMPVNQAEAGNGYGTGYGNGNGGTPSGAAAQRSGGWGSEPAASWGSEPAASWGSETTASWASEPAASWGSEAAGRGQESQAGWGQPPESASGWGQGQDSGGWGPVAGSWGPGGRRPSDIVSDPVQGEQTQAGLPMRVPKANLIPGSAPGTRGGGGPGDGNGLAGTRPGSSNESQTLPAPLPQRSPEVARSRLSGFQRGARRAESQPPRGGEGTDR